MQKISFILTHVLLQDDFFYLFCTFTDSYFGNNIIIFLFERLIFYAFLQKFYCSISVVMERIKIYTIKKIRFCSIIQHWNTFSIVILFHPFFFFFFIIDYQNCLIFFFLNHCIVQKHLYLSKLKYCIQKN